jgi:hypothetical protein
MIPKSIAKNGIATIANSIAVTPSVSFRSLRMKLAGLDAGRFAGSTHDFMFSTPLKHACHRRQ